MISCACVISYAGVGIAGAGMSDSFTEVTRRGWFSRIAGSFVGVLFGLLLIIGMIVLLF